MPKVSELNQAEPQAKIGALISELDPPTVAEIIQSLQPIPTLEECLSPLSGHRPALTGVHKARVEELEKEISELRAEKKFSEAIPFATEILLIRQEHQAGWKNAKDEPAEWYEVGDARRTVADLQRRASLTPEERYELNAADALRTEAETTNQHGDYADALELRLKEFTIRARLLGRDHPDTLLLFVRLNLLLLWTNRFEEADKSMRQTISDCARVLGQDHPFTFESLNDLGLLLLYKSDFYHAEILLRKALQQGRLILGDGDRLTLISLDNLGMVLRSQGRLLQAETCIRKARDGFLRFGKNDEDYLYATNMLGWLLRGRLKLDHAEELFREAWIGRRDVHGAEHYLTLSSLHNLGEVLLAQGKLVEAESALRTALKGFESNPNIGMGHRNTLICRSNLGLLLASCGMLPEAEAVLRHAVDGFRTGYADHPAIMHALRALGTVLLNQQDYTDSEKYLCEALDVAEKIRGRDTEDEVFRARMSKQLKLPETAEALAELYLDTNRPEDAFTTAERGRGLSLLDLLRRSGSASPHTLDLRDLGLHPDAKLQKGELVLSYVWGSKSVFLLLAEAETDAAEEADGIRGDETASRVSGLPLARGRRIQELTDLVGRFAAFLAREPESPGEQTDKPVAAELLPKLIPEQIWHRVKQASRLIILPSGPLNRIPFEALEAADEENVLFHEDVQMVYAESLTVFLNRRAAAHTRPTSEQLTALVLGDPAFAQLPVSSTRNRDDVSSLSQLKATGREARAIADSITRAGGTVELLLGEQATLTNLERSVLGKRHIHLATHAWMGSEMRPYDAGMALTRSELSPEHNGFLSLGRIVSNWNGKLEHCDLVVLSACETQKGVEIGDSTIALPWGFMYAGAPTVIASLWKVDDAPTALLMTRFYENLLGQYTTPRGRFRAGERMSKGEALREAKIWLKNLSRAEARPLLDALLTDDTRGEPRDRPMAPPDSVHPYESPYFWAAFILIGSPD